MISTRCVRAAVPMKRSVCVPLLARAWTSLHTPDVQHGRGVHCYMLAKSVAKSIAKGAVLWRTCRAMVPSQARVGSFTFGPEPAQIFMRRAQKVGRENAPARNQKRSRFWDRFSVPKMGPKNGTVFLNH